MRTVKLDQLQTLVEVVEHGSFTVAAQHLNLTQPAVTLKIRELEDRFGVQLIERLGKRAYPTKAGEELMAHARQLLAMADGAVSTMRKYSEGWLGQVRIGSSLTMLLHLLPTALRRIRSAHPNLELMVKTGITAETVARIRANTLDIGLCALPVEDPALVVEPLFDDTSVAILPRDVQSVPATIAPDDIAARPLVLGSQRSQMRKDVDQWLAAAGHRTHPAMELDNIEAMKSVVAAGLGVSIIPGLAVSRAADRADLRVVPLKPSFSRRVALVWRRDKQGEAFVIVRDALRAVEVPQISFDG